MVVRTSLCLWFVTEEELEQSKVYDGFISCSHNDEDFVDDNLVPGLENGIRRYKVCLHQRDWFAGEHNLEQISRLAEQYPRKTVVLLAGFLIGVWGTIKNDVSG